MENVIRRESREPIMHGAIVPPLEAWGNFYVIVGSSAGALTGLQFVVMTLIAQTEFARGRGESVSAFGSPNVVHFCAVLLVASVLSVPWSAMRPAGLAVAGCGMLGSIYSVVVVRRAHRQREYRPVFEDWLWHTILPMLAYAVLLGAGAAVEWSPESTLLAIAAAALLLVFIGIHNAWDTVTYVTMRAGLGEPRRGERAVETQKHGRRARDRGRSTGKDA
jgi:hypothetical protein